jgi:hypothetical protein
MATLTNASIIAQWNFNSNLDPTTEAANITAQTLGGLTDGNITPNIQHSIGEGTPVDGSGLPVDDGSAAVPMAARMDGSLRPTAPETFSITSTSALPWTAGA